MTAVQQQIDQVRLGDGTRVGFALAGSGPLLVLTPGLLSHLELSWALPQERRFYEALASGRTLLRYDRPGSGLSEPAPTNTAVDHLEMEVLTAVTDAVRATRYDVLGTSFGAPLAVRWAARNRDAVERLVLYGGWLHGHAIADPTIREQVLGMIEQHWGLGSDVLTAIFAPEADAELRAVIANYQRQCSSAETARRLLAACYEIDLTDDAARVRATTTVIHRDGDRAAPLDEARLLAGAIDGATFQVLPGRSHLPYVGDADALANEIRRALDLPPVTREADAVLTKRQLEVAALVAQGLSNRAIGEQLVIAERSAESHVERIRLRLGFRSRAQIAAWYVATQVR